MEAIFKTHGITFPTRNKAKQYEAAKSDAAGLAEHLDGLSASDIAQYIEDNAADFATVGRLFGSAKAPVRTRKKAQPESEAA